MSVFLLARWSAINTHIIVEGAPTMLNDRKQDLINLFNNIYNAEQWEQATTLLAIVATLIVSFIFVIRMLRYRDKTFLDWTIVFREIAWFLVAFRFTSSLGFEWRGWLAWSWLIWAYVAVTTILAFAASQREHYYAKHRRSPLDRLLRRNRHLDEETKG